jgi:methionine biosynthesis protein MetW
VGRDRVSGPASLLGRVFTASEDENRREILRTVLRTAPHRRVLDIGCFDGELSARLGRAAGAARVVGVELLDEHAAKARARGVEVHLAEIEDGLPFDDASFDLVHANQVIEHLRNTDGFLRETRRVCAPDGLILLSTNNLSSWHNVACLALGWQPMPNHVSDEVHVGNPMNLRSGEAHVDAGQTHLRIFTGRALAELAAHHGLETVELKTSGYYPVPPRAARPLARLDGRHGAFLIGLFRPAGYAESAAA